jgi:phospholipid transport system substrate-binding protein
VSGTSRIPCRATTYSMRKIIALGAVLALPGLGLSNVVTGVEPPTVVVRGTIDEVIRLVTDEGLKKPDQTDHRRKMLEETIGHHFDFEEMGKRSLAAHWRNRSEPEQQEFVRLFQTLLSKTYAGKIENYSGEKVQYLKERLKDAFAEVQTRIVSQKTEIALDYRLLLKDGNWRVYDVVVDGVSLVKNYRVQFDRIIRDSSYEELVKTLREKSGDITAP